MSSTSRDWTPHGPAVVLALLLGSLGVGACSLLLDWDPNEQPCGDEQRCLDGYSCYGTRCIADHSLAEQETCVADQQCFEGLVCTPEPSLVCRKPCDDFFVPSASCEPGSYCRPSPALDDGTPRGSCVRSECVADGDCESGRVCVRISDSASACLPPCSYAVSAAGVYSDHCRDPSHWCQPLGAAGEERVVCLQQSEVTQEAGEACDFALNTCAAGAVCVDGECRAFCEPVTGHPCCSGTNCPENCLTVATGDGALSYCSFP